MDVSKHVYVLVSDGGGWEEEGGQQTPHVAPALVGSSPLTARGDPLKAAYPSRQEPFEVTLHRKDNEGFGFVILTSKNKPPPGGKVPNIYVGMGIHKILLIL